jgi:hypothetical protein
MPIWYRTCSRNKGKAGLPRQLSLVQSAENVFVYGHGGCTISKHHDDRGNRANGHPVLLKGESGTGKEVYARLIHRLSGRRGMLRKASCAAMDTAVLHCQFSNYHTQFMVFRGRTRPAARPIGDPFTFRSDIPRILKIRMCPYAQFSPCASNFCGVRYPPGFNGITRPFVLR